MSVSLVYLNQVAACMMVKAVHRDFLISVLNKQITVACSRFYAQCRPHLSNRAYFPACMSVQIVVYSCKCYSYKCDSKCYSELCHPDVSLAKQLQHHQTFLSRAATRLSTFVAQFAIIFCRIKCSSKKV